MASTVVLCELNHATDNVNYSFYHYLYLLLLYTKNKTEIHQWAKNSEVAITTQDPQYYGGRVFFDQREQVLGAWPSNPMAYALI